MVRAGREKNQFLRAAGAPAAPRRRTGAPAVTQKLVRTITTTTFSTKNVEKFRENVEKLRETIEKVALATVFVTKNKIVMALCHKCADIKQFFLSKTFVEASMVSPLNLLENPETSDEYFRILNDPSDETIKNPLISN